jgi:single-strand DNA-binding protein
MNSVNMVVLSGRLGAPPEEKKTSGSKMMAIFRMATNRWDPKTESETADWHSIVCFDKQAELCVKHLTKGSAVLVEGRLVVRQWDGSDGKKQSRPEIIANRVTFLGASGATRGEAVSEGVRKPVLELGEVIPF